MDFRGVQLLEAITKFLDISGHFIEIIEKLEEWQNPLNRQDHCLPSLYFRIKVNFNILANISGNLADTLLKEPYIVSNFFNQVINLAVKSEEVKKKSKIGYVHTEIEISLPLICNMMSLPKRCAISMAGLFVIKGVVVSCTKIAKYCRSTVYRCPLEDCSGYGGQRVFGDQITASLCSYCGYAKEEVLRARENGEQVLAVLVNPIAFQPNQSIRSEGITVCFKDDLIKCISLGICYNVTVSRAFSQYIAWGIERTTSEAQWRFSKGLPTVGLPRSIMRLEEHLKEHSPDSPWALTVTLSSQIASHLYPVNSFLQLKTGLLLSLASQSEDHIPVPLLAVGPDCNSLLHYASQLSRRYVPVTCAALCGSLGANVGETWLEAGSLLLAAGGVCYLGDWAKFGSGKSSMASQIIAALDSGRISLVSPSNTMMSSPPSEPLSAAVWTFWSGGKATASARTQLRTLIEVFGMPFIGDGGTDVQAVADHLLYESMKARSRKVVQDNAVPVQDLKEYLNIVCSYNVELTSEASKLLRNYFVASRRDRPDCLPLKSLKTMTALAEAQARLCLRTQVTYSDVVLVAYLNEESISALYGPSPMSPPPSMFAANTSSNTTIAEQMTQTLRNFSVWLEWYIKSLLSEGSVNCSLPEE